LFFSTDETDVTTVLQGKIKVVTFDRAIIGGAAAGAVLLVIIIILILWKVKLYKLVPIYIVGSHASVLQLKILSCVSSFVSVKME
jgi:hypothetical protein